MPCAPWESWSLDERKLPITSLFALLWSNCLPSPITSSNKLPSNSMLKREQGHDYFLNWFHFATWKSGELFLFPQVRELFLLLSPGSSRQSSCDFLQPHLTCPSTIHGRTGMKRDISWMNTILPLLLRVLLSQSFDFRSSQYYHMKFHPSRNALVILLKILSCLSVKTHLQCFCKRHQEIQLFSTILWGARIEVSLAASWVVLPAC